MEFTSELKISKRAAVKAGIRILEIYDDYISSGQLEVVHKADCSPLTEADREANKIIVGILKGRFPGYSILSEETADDKSRLQNKFCWIIDPLDGTKEFIKRNGEFTVNIGLSYENKPVLGVVYVPVTGELFYASKSNGAYYENGVDSQKIHVTNRTDDIRLVISRSHALEEERLIEKYAITNVKRAGSSLKGCLVAKGEAEAYYRFGNTMEWDTSAMHCIAEEAGAIFRQLDDTEMLYNRQNSLNDRGFYVINDARNKMVV